MDRDKEVPYMEDHQEIARETRKYDATQVHWEQLGNWFKINLE